MPLEVYDLMREYLVYIFLGIAATFLYNYFANLLRAVGNSVVPLIFLAVSLLTPYFQYAVMIYALYYILIGFSLHRFICASYTNGVFDKLINSKIEGVQVGRGLYVEEEDDGEDKSEEDAAEDSAALPDDASAPSSENKAESAND